MPVQGSLISSKRSQRVCSVGRGDCSRERKGGSSRGTGRRPLQRTYYNRSTINDQRIKNQLINDQRINDQRINDQQINDQWINDQRINDQRILLLQTSNLLTPGETFLREVRHWVQRNAWINFDKRAFYSFSRLLPLDSCNRCRQDKPICQSSDLKEMIFCEKKSSRLEVWARFLGYQ